MNLFDEMNGLLDTLEKELWESPKANAMQAIKSLRVQVATLEANNHLVVEHVNELPDSVSQLMNNLSRGKFGSMARASHSFHCNCADAKKDRDELLAHMAKHLEDLKTAEPITRGKLEDLLEGIFGKDGVKIMVTTLDDLVKQDPDEFFKQMFGRDKPKFH